MPKFSVEYFELKVLPGLLRSDVSSKFNLNPVLFNDRHKDFRALRTKMLLHKVIKADGSACPEREAMKRVSRVFKLSINPTALFST